ncbi:MAG TPA: hypothetical protein VGC76_15060 [Pyrinomonadaceae bacterium]|jgi:hypothetical protein
MKHRPIHENLDTSFVNVAALVRYLRRRGFVGQVRVELSGYEADIYLGEANNLRAREYDRIAGRIAEGEEALQRILIRSREPGGTVNVYQEVSENEAAAEKLIVPEPKKTGENPPPIQNIKPVAVEMPSKKPQNLPAVVAEAAPPRQKLTLEHFPFELRNKVEDKARNTSLAPDDWQMLLNLTGELLATIDKTLAAANLDFAAAFEKARAEISVDYPFLSSNSGVFAYKNGKITMREQPNAKLFTASILEILQRIMEKLGANPKFNILYSHTTQQIRALAGRRKQLYDKFFITNRLEKIVGT